MTKAELIEAAMTMEMKPDALANLREKNAQAVRPGAVNPALEEWCPRPRKATGLEEMIAETQKMIAEMQARIATPTWYVPAQASGQATMLANQAAQNYYGRIYEQQAAAQQFAAPQGLQAWLPPHAPGALSYSFDQSYPMAPEIKFTFVDKDGKEYISPAAKCTCMVDQSGKSVRNLACSEHREPAPTARAGATGLTGSSGPQGTVRVASQVCAGIKVAPGFPCFGQREMRHTAKGAPATLLCHGHYLHLETVAFGDVAAAKSVLNSNAPERLDHRPPPLAHSMGVEDPALPNA